MILTFTAMFTLWLLTVTYLAVWYGILFAVGVAAITIAMMLFAVAWLLTCARGIFSERTGRFG